MDQRQSLRGNFRCLGIFSRLVRGGPRIFDFRYWPLFPPFSVLPYIRMYVRAFRGPVGACVWMCLGEAKTAGTPTARCARDVRI